MIMRLDDHGHVFRASVFAELAQTRGHAGLGLIAWHRAFVGLRLAPEDANVGCLKGRCKIDEAAGICQLLGTFGWIFHIQLRRTTHARNPQFAGTGFLLGSLNSIRSKEREGWSIEFSFRTLRGIWDP